MYQVTTDLESRLYELEQRRGRLVKGRDDLIREAERMIARANSEFDDAAVSLGREINELRERLQRQEPEPKRQEPKRQEHRRNSHKPPMLDGLDDDEQEHYKQLLARRKGK